MIRILQELSALDGGGVAKLLYDYYLHMDREKYHFDFLIYDFYDEGMYEEPLSEMGSTIYKLPVYKKDPKKCSRMRSDIIKNGNYDVVHSHSGIGSFRVLKDAAKYHVPMRIAHSHIAYEPFGIKTKLSNIIKKILIKHYSTDLLACGVDAGIFMWGFGAMKAGKVRIMKNAIDTDMFRFSEDKRMQVREALGIQDGTFAVGTVGRLSDQKNFPFLFSVYKEFLKNRPDSILLIAGRGLEEDSIRRFASDMDIMDKTRFLGIRDDIPDLLNAFDVFALPSKYEGLPVVLVEAQANGLPEFVSEKVTDEMDVTGIIRFLPIGKGDEGLWAQEMDSVSAGLTGRGAYADIVRGSGYDINTAAKKLEKFYDTCKR